MNNIIVLIEMKCLEQKYGENKVVWVTSVCLGFLNGRN